MTTPPPETSLIALKIVYAANILVAGYVGALSLFAPRLAERWVFSRSATASPSMTVAGALWFGIAVLSGLGLFRPLPFSAVLVLQLVYKGSWLLVAALPALLSRGAGPFPWPMAGFFLVWCVVLPFVIPFRHLFGP